MRTCLRTSLLYYLMLLVFSHTSEGLFFHYPKQALMSFLEKLGGYKQMLPIHHYHMHYYPLPVPLVIPKPLPPPPQIEIDFSSPHSGYNQVHSLDWSGNGRSNIPEPDVSLPGSQSSWPNLDHQWDNTEILDKDQLYKETKHPGISLQVPLHQRIILYQPPSKDSKSKLLKTFLSKLRRINDALFHPEDDYTEDHNSKPVISNSLTYAA